MAYLNETRIIGHVGNNVKAGVTRGGTDFASFNIAVTKKRKDKDGQQVEKTTWFAVVCYKHTAKFAAQYVKKGDQLFVGGEITDRQWQDSNGKDRITKELLSDNIQITRSKSPYNPAGHGAAPAAAPSENSGFGGQVPAAGGFDQTPPETNFNQTPPPRDEDLPF